jgi:hypothetical protein
MRRGPLRDTAENRVQVGERGMADRFVTRGFVGRRNTGADRLRIPSVATLPLWGQDVRVTDADEAGATWPELEPAAIVDG